MKVTRKPTITVEPESETALKMYGPERSWWRAIVDGTSVGRGSRIDVDALVAQLKTKTPREVQELAAVFAVSEIPCTRCGHPKRTHSNDPEFRATLRATMGVIVTRQADDDARCRAPGRTAKSAGCDCHGFQAAAGAVVAAVAKHLGKAPS